MMLSAAAVLALGLALAMPARAQAQQQPQPQPQPQRLALLIGSSAYTAWPALDGCRTSVNGLAGALRRAGFAVTERLNPSNAQMGAAISEFSDAVNRTGAAEVVSYVCGYTIALDKRIFLLPVSANVSQDTDALSQGILGRLFINTATRPSVRGGLILLDAVAWLGRADKSAVLPMAALVDAAAPPAAGYAAVQTLVPLQAGMTELASAAAAAITHHRSDWGAATRQLRQSLSNSAQRSVVMVEPSLEPANTKPVNTKAVNTMADIRRMQLALQRLGYYAGKVDGVAGADTLAAVRRFQHELGAEMTGQLTAAQNSRLLKDSP